MEIVIKNADFSANAVTKLTEPFSTFLNGCYLSDGSFSAGNRYYHSLGVIPISEDMRNNGFIVQNMGYINDDNYPLIVFFNSDEPSTSSFVGKIYYKTGPLHTIKIYAEQIPATATHFVVNVDINTVNGKVFENYFIPVVDEFSFTDGLISATGEWQDNPDYKTTQMIAVNSGETYYIPGTVVSKFDKWGNFISRDSWTTGLFKPVTFDTDVYFVRLSYYITYYCYFEY